jgi:hypothetical protein
LRAAAALAEAAAAVVELVGLGQMLQAHFLAQTRQPSRYWL